MVAALAAIPSLVTASLLLFSLHPKDTGLFFVGNVVALLLLLYINLYINRYFLWGGGQILSRESGHCWNRNQISFHDQLPPKPLEPFTNNTATHTVRKSEMDTNSPWYIHRQEPLNCFQFQGYISRVSVWLVWFQRSSAEVSHPFNKWEKQKYWINQDLRILSAYF